MKRPFIIHPFLFAIFPILFFTTNNIAELWTIGQGYVMIRLVNIMIVVLSFASLLWILLRYVFKDWHRSGIFVSLFLLMFFSYGHLIELIQKLGYESTFEITGFKLQTYHLYFLVWIIIFVGFIYLFQQKTRSFFTLTRFLNIVSVTLLCFNLLNIIVYTTKSNIWQAILWEKNLKEVTRTNETQETLPDIYYIILDGYCAESTLKEYYRFDNKDFINYLERKGFYVASESVSNYPFTMFSLASSLNMEYLDNLTNIMGINSTDLSPALSMIKDNKVAYFLKTKGYDIVHIGWQSPPDYDFLSDLINTTILSLFSSRGGFDKFTRKRKHTLFEFYKITHVHRTSDKPVFVYAHFLLPHAPYVFGSRGEAVAKEDGKGYDAKRYYINQLIFTNKKIEKVIDKILLKSRTSPIIVLQADHGIGNTIARRMRILNAYYLPQDGRNLLYKSVTPVNTFRIIFNKYFGEDYKLLNDQNYFSWWEPGHKPYSFINVTNEVNYDKENVEKQEPKE